MEMPRERATPRDDNGEIERGSKKLLGRARRRVFRPQLDFALRTSAFWVLGTFAFGVLWLDDRKHKRTRKKKEQKSTFTMMMHIFSWTLGTI